MKRRLERLMRRLLAALGWCGICGEFHWRQRKKPPRLTTDVAYTYEVKAYNGQGREVRL